MAGEAQYFDIAVAFASCGIMRVRGNHGYVTAHIAQCDSQVLRICLYAAHAGGIESRKEAN